MKHIFLVLILVGCGGESFSGFAVEDEDATSIDGGVQETGGAASGGASVGTGGRPGAGGGGADAGEADAGSGGESSGGTASADSGSTGGSGGSIASGGHQSGGAGGVSSGGAPASGGALGSGGAVDVDACAPVTHSNGVGQTWGDCTPLGTHNGAEARLACDAWCAANGCLGCWQSVCGDVGAHAAYMFGEVSASSDTATGWSMTTGDVVRVNLITGSCVTIGTWN